MGVMLVHLRLTVPPDLTGDLLARMRGHEYATNVVAQYGVVVDPEADLIELGSALRNGISDRKRRTVFKTVGVAAQDWAIARLLAMKFLPNQ